MVSVCFYFQVHQPYRLRKYHVFEIGNHNNYFDEKKNEEICKKVARKCYLPANQLIKDLIHETDGRFKVSYSLSGVVLEQFMKYTPRVLESFIELAETGAVEFLDETYYHSLASLYSEEEFRKQVQKHRDMMKDLFNQKPKVFRNTELIYNNRLGELAEEMGYVGVLAEGADHVLGWRSPNYIYRPVSAKNVKLLLKNYRLSDDVAFRFSQESWEGWPLTADKYANWISAVNGGGEVVNLFMDYETFGEHQWADTGIFDFLRHLPKEILRHEDNDFKTPTEIINSYPARGEIDAPQVYSWADVERDISAWVGNQMQETAIQKLYNLEQKIKEKQDPSLLEDWRRMQTGDHFYYMCTKYFNDGDVHKYFNAYERPHDAFIAFVNVLNDMNMRVRE